MIFSIECLAPEFVGGIVAFGPIVGGPIHLCAGYAKNVN